MGNTRKIKLIVRWSLVTAGLIAFFWTIWYLVAGNVPIVTSIKMTETWTIQLPFGISRWWDILIGPIWATAIILISTSERITKDEDFVIGLVAGLGAGLGALIKWICSKSFWIAIGNWFLAKDIRTGKI